MSGREREGARERKRKQVVEPVTGCAHSFSVELLGTVLNAIHPFNKKRRRKKKTGLTQGMLPAKTGRPGPRTQMTQRCRE